MEDTSAIGPEKGTMRLRLILLACAPVLLGAALVIGINDNPPGIGLAFLSSLAVVLAFTITLQTPRQYAHLLLLSLLAFVVAAILHNVFEAAASVAGADWLRMAGQTIGVAFFLLAIFLCPAGIVVGGIGVLVKMSRRPGRPE